MDCRFSFASIQLFRTIIVSDIYFSFIAIDVSFLSYSISINFLSVLHALSTDHFIRHSSSIDESFVRSCLVVINRISLLNQNDIQRENISLSSLRSFIPLIVAYIPKDMPRSQLMISHTCHLIKSGDISKNQLIKCEKRNLTDKIGIEGKKGNYIPTEIETNIDSVLTKHLLSIVLFVSLEKRSVDICVLFFSKND